MTAHQPHPEPEATPDAASLNLGAIQLVDVVSGVVQDLDETGQRVHMVMERAPTIIADSTKLAEATASLLRSALQSGPANGPIEVAVAGRCLAPSHEPAASGGERQACRALVSVAIRDRGEPANQTTRRCMLDAGAEFETALMSAQKIVRLHQGRLWVTTRPEHGRTLGFCLNSEEAA